MFYSDCRALVNLMLVCSCQRRIYQLPFEVRSIIAVISISTIVGNIFIACPFKPSLFCLSSVINFVYTSFFPLLGLHIQLTFAECDFLFSFSRRTFVLCYRLFPKTWIHGSAWLLLVHHWLM